MTLYIRYFFIIFCTIYIYNKILNISIQNKILNQIINSIFSIILCLALISISYVNPDVKFIFLYFTTFIFLKISTRTKALLSMIVLVLSFGISLISLSLSSLLISTCFTVIFSNTPIINNMSILFIGLIQYAIIFILFKNKRLTNGMPFIYKKSFIGYGLYSSFIAIVIFLAIQHLPPQSRLSRLIILFLFFLLTTLFLIWWRHKITQSYVEKLRVDEVELLYKEISDKDLEIEKLHAHNEQLSGIIHKDNKLIPAMEMAVRNYLQTAALMKPEDARQTGVELLSKLERMAEERTGIIHTYQENFSYRQRSGLISIDAIVDYMENRASTLGIEYHYQFDKTLKEMLPAFITEDDAMHLLSDLIENAIIAASHSEKKNIHIHIGFIRSILFIDISDSGIPFTPETYEKFGNIQYTTHAEHGGSGIGLMDIAKLKKQYQFSLQIYEYPEKETIYTKKIRILFDRKSHYLIQSYRAKELRSAILRNDLHVIPYSDKEKP